MARCPSLGRPNVGIAYPLPRHVRGLEFGVAPIGPKIRQVGKLGECREGIRIAAVDEAGNPRDALHRQRVSCPVGLGIVTLETGFPEYAVGIGRRQQHADVFKVAFRACPVQADEGHGSKRIGRILAVAQHRNPEIVDD